MAEAMIINQQLDASPDKKQPMQQLYPPQQLQYRNQFLAQQQQINAGPNNDNNNNFDGCFPGYMYSCYPFVVSQAKFGSTSGHDMKQSLPGPQHQQVPSESSFSPLQQQHQPVMFHNGLIPNGYFSGFYSLVPLQSMLTNDTLPCQQVTPDHNYHPHLTLQSVEGQGVQTMLGPIVGYPLPFMTQHFQQQQMPTQAQLKSLQYFNCNISAGGHVEGHRKVIVMKDMSLQTEFNEKISERPLLELPNSFYISPRDGYQFENSPSNDVSDPLSKGTDTYSLLKGQAYSDPTNMVSPHLFLGPSKPYYNHHHQHDLLKGTNPNISSRHQFDNLNPHFSHLTPQNHLMNATFHQSLLQKNTQNFCFSNYINPMQSHVFQFPNNLNAFPPLNTSMMASIKDPTRNEAERKQKFYRKTRMDQGQRMANPTFEVKKEFSDIVDAVGYLVAQSGSVRNSEPSSRRASSKSADQSRNPSEEKILAANSTGSKGQKNARQSFVGKSANITENCKFANRNNLDVFSKMQGYLPLQEPFAHLPFNVYNGRSHQRVDMIGWSQTSFQKNQDVRSTKRKQQKRQMLANKAAEEEMEEISKERDNLLKGIMTTKQVPIPGEPNLIDSNADDGVASVQQRQADVSLQRHDNLETVHGEEDDKRDNVQCTKFEDFVDENPATLEFIEEPSEMCISNPAPVNKHFHGNNSLEEDPSPLSQMSPLTFSPPLSCPNELMDCEGYTTVVSKIHSKRFREYCSQVLDKEIDEKCVQLLQDLVKFQDQMYHTDPSKAKLKKRFVLGLREVAKHLKMGKLKCVIISPNLEQTQSKGGLDEALKSIIETCQSQEVPFIFALGRRALGRACAKLVPVSVVGVFSYEGVEENFAVLKSLTEKARDAYAEMVNSFKKEAVVHKEIASNKVDSIEEHETSTDVKDKCDPLTKSMPANAVASAASAMPVGPPPGGFEKLFPHLGHSRTPSACSAISFVSSVLSEPISENLPISEPEVEGKNNEIERHNLDKDSIETRDEEIEVKQTLESEVDRLKEKSVSAQVTSFIVESPVSSFATMAINETVTRDNMGHSVGSIRSPPESSERSTSDVLHRGSLLESAAKTALMSILENCELEIPANMTCHGLDQQHNVDVPIKKDSEWTTFVAVEEEDCFGNWRRKKNLSDFMRKTSCLEDLNDGNDADTEDERGGRNSDGGVANTSPRVITQREGKESNFPPPTHLTAGMNKSRRRRSKEDKSDDDKTIILSKDDEDALVFALESCSLERYQRCTMSPAVPQVEVVLARFTATSLSEQLEQGDAMMMIQEIVPPPGFKESTKVAPLLSNLPSTSSTASRIESWVAESQKALRDLSLLAEDDVDDDEVDDSDEVDDDGMDDRESGDDYE